MTALSICHFNDVYRVAPQKISSKSTETIDVTQFAFMLDEIRNKWPECSDGSGKKNGLVLFSGDVFSPSVESSVTRGSHMVPVMNELAPDVSLAGNHDFDFGYAHLSKLIQDTKFPWLLSNIIDTITLAVPEHLQEYRILERAGVRIGVIGLVEKEWLATVSAWPSNFEYRDMGSVAMELSKKLRGEHKCDIIIALTHARVPNDIKLAKSLAALSPSAQNKTPNKDVHGVDLLLGGHDHLYYVSKGVQGWNGFDYAADVLGGENDHGDILLVKSGTDFRDLSEIQLELEDTPAGSIRRKVIKSITGTRHTTKPGSPSSDSLTKLLKTLLGTVSKTMKAPVCRTAVALDCQSQMIRTEESASGNWFADVVRHAYDDALCMQGCGGSDGVFLCAGTFRGDSVYGPGNVSLGDILEILPFEDPIVVLSLDGAAIWDAMEASLSTWPAQEGRFPVISGFRVSWDSTLPAGQRVKDIHLVKEAADSIHDSSGSGTSTPRIIEGPRILRETGGRMYKIVTREYMAQGHDGFTALANHTYLIDDETGQLLSTLVRRYLLGSQYVNRMSQMSDSYGHDFLHASSQSAIAREKEHRTRAEKKHAAALQRWKHAASLVLHGSRSRAHYQSQIKITNQEHMSQVDPCDGTNLRKGLDADFKKVDDNDLLTIHPVVDGRLKDEGRK